MNKPPSRRTAAAAASVLLCAVSILAAAPAPVAAPAEPGDLWEVTTQMSMEGMQVQLPASTQRVCAAKEWKEPPGPKDERHPCQTTDFKTVGTKTTWKMSCSGSPAMTGEGEITRAADTYAGIIKLTSTEGAMTMKLNGRRVGDCDAADSKRQMAQAHAKAVQAQKAGADTQAQVCKSLVAAMDLHALTAASAICTDPALKQEFCRRLETEEGYALVASCSSGRDGGLNDEAAYCGKDPATLTKAVCKTALEKESLDLLGKCCPVEAQGIAQRECAGRGYTAVSASKYGAFCVNYARAEMAGTAAQPVEPESKAAKAKKTLKGIFKR